MNIEKVKNLVWLITLVVTGVLAVSLAPLTSRVNALEKDAAVLQEQVKAVTRIEEELKEMNTRLSNIEGALDIIHKE